MSSRWDVLRVILDLNTRLFLNALVDLDDAIATTRPNGNTNHMSFIACHALDARYILAELLDCPAEHPFTHLFEGAGTIEDMEVFPHLGRLRAAWEDVSRRLAEGWGRLDDEQAGRLSPQAFPIQDPTLVGAVAFLLEHESHHIGQLAYLRRYFGLPAMRWTGTSA